MATIKKDDTTFTLLDEIQKKHPELVKLILDTESMDTTEKQYWFDILPSMTTAQVKKLYDILETERKKLEELEKKYQKEIEQLNEKHLIEWQQYQMKKNKQKIKEQEANESSSSQKEANAAIEDW